MYVHMYSNLGRLLSSSFAWHDCTIIITALFFISCFDRNFLFLFFGMILHCAFDTEKKIKKSINKRQIVKLLTLTQTQPASIY